MERRKVERTWRVRHRSGIATVVSLLGGLVGVLLALWGVDTVAHINSDQLPLVGTIDVDRSVLAFSLVVSVGTGILFGLVPALQASRVSVADGLKDAGSQWAAIRGLKGRSFLVVAEVALALVLLVSSGLMIKSLSRLVAARTGVDPARLLSMRINLPGLQYGSQASLAFFQELETRVAGLPGVQAAGMGNCSTVAVVT